jgi:cysteinyl-tRNA synthetase
VLTGMGCTGREIRYWLLSSHYRKPVTLSQRRLTDTKHSLKRIDSCIRNLLLIHGARPPFSGLDQLLYDLKSGFVNAMDDDLNISVALGSLFKNIKKINTLIQERRLDPYGAEKILDAFRNIDQVLAVFDFSRAEMDEETQNILREREQARTAKNWELADSLRDRLMARGVVVNDGKIK